MKVLAYSLLVLCSIFVLTKAEPPKEIKDPKIHAYGAGSPKDGFGVGVDVRKNIWQSDNGKHSFDATAGYSQHLGGPYGNSPPAYRGGGIYTYRW